MTTCSYRIAGGDYEHAGSASRSLKELLKSVGVEPQAVRKVMVAAYEAEMNVVIHSLGGMLRAAVDGSRVRVEVDDDGPGIADIALAMKEGWSTAPARARELGFGAGLGLPNIQRHSDEFSIESGAGRGTSVRFTINFDALAATDRAVNSLRLQGDLCRQCMQCVHACPTQAMRVHRAVPNVLPHLCIECTTCIERCPAGAIGMEGPSSLPSLPPGTALLLHPAFLFQFGAGVDPLRVVDALLALGFSGIHPLSAWERAHSTAVRKHARSGLARGPVISSCCPAVLNLVETRFPSLLSEVAPFVTPEEAAAHDLRDAPVVMSVCPAQRTSLLAGVPEDKLLDPHLLRDLIASALRRSQPSLQPTPGAPACAAPLEPGVLRVEGIRGVVQTLEELENGHLAGLELLELYACEHGCFGSGLLRGSNAALARHRWATAGMKATVEARAYERERPLAARSGIRLDPDMQEAMARLARIQELVAALPGRDCGQCGAPSCRAFAEDVVLDRISRRACTYASWSRGKTS
jgi:anti-sigma regulatory factor (Ser/Thr protein kinase)/Fe-S-cluster-containing hydrogenase component 2